MQGMSDQMRTCWHLREEQGSLVLQAVVGDSHANGQCSPQQLTPVILLGVFLGLPLDTAFQGSVAMSVNGGVALGDLGGLCC